MGLCLNFSPKSVLGGVQSSLSGYEPQKRKGCTVGVAVVRLTNNVPVRLGSSSEQILVSH